MFNQFHVFRLLKFGMLHITRVNLYWELCESVIYIVYLYDFLSDYKNSVAPQPQLRKLQAWMNIKAWV